MIGVFIPFNLWSTYSSTARMNWTIAMMAAPKAREPVWYLNVLPSADMTGRAGTSWRRWGDVRLRVRLHVGRLRQKLDDNFVQYLHQVYGKQNTTKQKHQPTHIRREQSRSSSSTASQRNDTLPYDLNVWKQNNDVKYDVWSAHETQVHTYLLVS